MKIQIQTIMLDGWDAGAQALTCVAASSRAVSLWIIPLQISNLLIDCSLFS